ncbi:MAG TPA: hypothetical protein ENN17_12790 [bacterium]|nr:hypothetical protein [bacterium]
MKGSVRYILIFSIGLGLFPAAAGNPGGDWFFHSAEVPTDNPGHIDLTLGIRAASSADTFRLGNHNVRGHASGALYGFGSEHPPRIVRVMPDSLTATLTRPPGTPNGWQINAVYEGAPGGGARPGEAGGAVATIRFFIHDTAGTSGFGFGPLQQTFTDDNITPVAAEYDPEGGDVPLWHRTIPDTTADTTHTAVATPAPGEFALFPNFPNPFNLETRIRYHLPKTSDVRIRILNLAGQTVTGYDFGRQFAGEYTTVWDGTDRSGHVVTSGLYLVHFRADRFEKIMKILLAK